jgi:hypothetical protein
MKFITYMCAMFVLFTVLSTAAFADNAATVDGVSATVENYNLTYTEASDLKDTRGFAIPGDVAFPGMPGYFGEKDKTSHNFIPVEYMTLFQKYWDVRQVDNMLKKKTSKDIQVRALYAASKVPSKEMYVATVAPDSKNVRTLAFATVAAKSKSGISPGVFAQTLKEASKLGANYVMFMGQGTTSTVTSWGVGVGFSHTNADLKGGGNGSSGVSTGGTGWSYGEAKYVFKPWVQAAFLKIPAADLPTR